MKGVYKQLAHLYPPDDDQPRTVHHRLWWNKPIAWHWDTCEQTCHGTVTFPDYWWSYSQHNKQIITNSSSLMTRYPALSIKYVDNSTKSLEIHRIDLLYPHVIPKSYNLTLVGEIVYLDRRAIQLSRWSKVRQL